MMAGPSCATARIAHMSEDARGTISPALGAKISFLDGLVAANFIRRAGREHAAVHQHRDAICQSEYYAHVVLDHDQRLAFADVADEFDRVARFGVAHAGG